VTPLWIREDRTRFIPGGLQFIPSKPISWPPAVVSDCQYSNGDLSLKVYNVKGKVFNRSTASLHIGRDIRYRCTSFRKLSDPLDCSGYCFEKAFAKPASLSFIPQGRVFQLPVGLGLSEQRFGHCFERRFSSRCLTSSQGDPAEAPERIRRARRSISTPQALPTSAESSDSSSSRLASNSTATSARSLTESLRASSKTLFRVIR
jgi:hypothetical protein